MSPTRDIAIPTRSRDHPTGNPVKPIGCTEKGPRRYHSTRNEGRRPRTEGT